jgi:hypothetical protein
MDGAFTDVWPEGEPTSLWNFHLLRPEDDRLLPFMGVRVEWPFLLAYLVGALLIAFFAWRRFRTRTFDPSELDARVIRELLPDQLRGRGPLLRAYGYYAFVMLVIYTPLVFFGGVILPTINSFDMAGLQVDVNPTYLSSPAWPIGLAMGIAGFTELIKPVEILESWLRQKAHEWVGIPVKIKEHTRELLKNLDAIVRVDSYDERMLPDWVKGYVSESDSLERVLRTREKLELLMRLTRDEDGWPKVEVRDELRQLEGVELNEAEMALQDFQDATASRQSDPRKREAKLRHAIDTMKRLETDLGATLSVYGERDRNFSRIKDPGLKRVMEKTFPAEQPRLGPDAAIARTLFFVFFVYFVVVATGQQSLLTGTTRILPIVFVTALVETARIAALFLVPVWAVFFWRGRAEAWQPVRLASASGASFGQAIKVLLVAGAVSLVGLALLAIGAAALVSDGETSFNQNLFSGRHPILQYYLWQTGAGAINALIVVAAADDNADQTAAPAWVYGGLNLVLVSGWMVGHLVLVSGTSPCTEDGTILLDAFADSRCFRLYNFTDFLVYAVLAVLAAGVFARPRREGTAPGPATAPTAKAAVLLVAALVSPDPATSQQAPASSVAAAVPKTATFSLDSDNVVVAGFRSDVEPFSFLSQASLSKAGERRFDGYIADLCYDIFEGSRYHLFPVLVTAEKRFDQLRTDPEVDYNPLASETDQKIDVLCDPVTLRFALPDNRAEHGIFSPIVFTSGVSYMYRPTRTPEGQAHAYLVYVVKTTALPVVELACEIDLLGIRKEGVGEDCEPPPLLNDDCPVGAESTRSGGAAYHFCAVESHTDAIRIFCRDYGEEPDFEIAYFGDREIILGKLDAWKHQDEYCPPTIETEFPYYTYEPYALLVTKSRPDLVQFVQRRVYEIFSDRSEAVSHFTEHFPGVKMSPVLADLFLLNAVDEWKYFRSSPPAGKPARAGGFVWAGPDGVRN